jgi:DNA-binding transcriptional LysR family regulator
MYNIELNVFRYLLVIDMDLRHMRYFLTVANELHFTRASKALHIAQPALSKQIRDLEDELGVTLLNRSGRRITLSDAGQVFYEKASKILQATEAAIVETQRAQRGETGKIAIGFFEQTAYTLLPPILRKYRHRFPEVDIQLRWHSVAEQRDVLVRGEIDVAFIRLIRNGDQFIESFDDLTKCKLYSEKFVLAIPANHRFEHQEVVAITDCANESFISYAEGFAPDFHATILRLCAIQGFTPKTSLEVGQTYTLLGLVSAGVGIAFVPASAQKMKLEGLIFKRLEDQLPDIEIYLAWAESKPSALVSALVDTARETITDNFPLDDPQYILT